MQNTRCVYLSWKVCGWDYGLAFVTYIWTHKTVGLSDCLRVISVACSCDKSFGGRMRSFDSSFPSAESWFACRFYAGLTYFLFIRLARLSIMGAVKNLFTASMLRYTSASGCRLALLPVTCSWYKPVSTRLTQLSTAGIFLSICSCRLCGGLDWGSCFDLMHENVVFWPDS